MPKIDQIVSSICFGFELAAKALSFSAEGGEGRGGEAAGCWGEAAPLRREWLSRLRAPPKGALPPLRRRAPPLLIHCLDKSILSRQSQAPPAASSSSSPSSVWGVTHLSAAGKAGARGRDSASLPWATCGAGGSLAEALCGGRQTVRASWLGGGDRARSRPAWRDSPGVWVRGGGSVCVSESSGSGRG